MILIVLLFTGYMVFFTTNGDYVMDKWWRKSNRPFQLSWHKNFNFSNGETEEFLTNFSRLVPKEVQLLDKTCILLIFELNLYFMTYPLRGNPNINQFRLQHRNFVQYLEEIAAHNEVMSMKLINNWVLLVILCIAESTVYMAYMDRVICNNNL